jgi:hypothetical protein
MSDSKPPFGKKAEPIPASAVNPTDRLLARVMEEASAPVGLLVLLGCEASGASIGFQVPPDLALPDLIAVLRSLVDRLEAQALPNRATHVELNKAGEITAAHALDPTGPDGPLGRPGPDRSSN